jgi:hypothetical protein
MALGVAQAVPPAASRLRSPGVAAAFSTMKAWPMTRDVARTLVSEAPRLTSAFPAFAATPGRQEYPIQQGFPESGICALIVGRAILPAAAFQAAFCLSQGPKSRLKAGCSQDCLPHNFCRPHVQRNLCGIGQECLCHEEGLSAAASGLATARYRPWQ